MGHRNTEQIIHLAHPPDSPPFPALIHGVPTPLLPLALLKPPPKLAPSTLKFPYPYRNPELDGEAAGADFAPPRVGVNDPESSSANVGIAFPPSGRVDQSTSKGSLMPR